MRCAPSIRARAGLPIVTVPTGGGPLSPTFRSPRSLLPPLSELKISPVALHTRARLELVGLPDAADPRSPRARPDAPVSPAPPRPDTASMFFAPPSTPAEARRGYHPSPRVAKYRVGSLTTRSPRECGGRTPSPRSPLAEGCVEACDTSSATITPTSVKARRDKVDPLVTFPLPGAIVPSPPVSPPLHTPLQQCKPPASRRSGAPSPRPRSPTGPHSPSGRKPAVFHF